MPTMPNKGKRAKEKISSSAARPLKKTAQEKNPSPCPLNKTIKDTNPSSHPPQNTKKNKKVKFSRKSRGKNKSSSFPIDSCTTLIGKSSCNEAAKSRAKYQPTSIDKNHKKLQLDIYHVNDFFNHHGDRLKAAKDKIGLSKVVKDVLDGKNGIVWWKHVSARVTSFNPSTEMQCRQFQFLCLLTF